MKKRNSLMLWIITLQIVGFAMGEITTASLDPWYLSLTKSQLTPPGYLFGIVWTILYVMLAITGWELFNHSTTQRISTLRVLFGAQLLLNWLWTPLFFYFHWISLALICLLGIVVLTTAIVIQSFEKARSIFWLMLPYWVWVCFASYLNAVILSAN